MFVVSHQAVCQKNETSSLRGKIICIDPGHGGTALTDSYRVGPSGEREEWINLRVGLLLQAMLLEKGAKVLMTRTEDKFIALTDRAKVAVDGKADFFVSIHHNATADSSVNFPIIYFHGNATENVASVDFGKILAVNIVKTLYQNSVTPRRNHVSVVSDFTVFAESGASVLRNTYGIPAVLAEASFFTNALEEQKLKREDHNQAEALAYAAALEGFFSKPLSKIDVKNSKVPPIPPFRVFQEAERMTPIAERWHQDFLDAEKLLVNEDSASLQQAYDLFTRSVRSFPDSYVAAQCHARRAYIFNLWNKPEDARTELLRVKEQYVKMEEY